MTTTTDNYNSNNETLFWKVIHNVYTFNKIINSIHDHGHIEYDDINKINLDNRIKFKDITSLEWMIKHGQYELLKCKLQSNEEIEIKESTVKDMIREYILNHQNDTAVATPLLESLQLLFKYKPEELCDFNLLESIFRQISVRDNANSQIIGLISNYQTVYPSVLEFAIEHSKSVDIVDAIINSPLITISTSTKNKSIYNAFRNTNCKQDMVQLILNNAQLYSIPSTSSTATATASATTTTKYKKFKSDDGESKVIGSRDTENEDTTIGDTNRILKISLLDILSLRSIDNQDKLIKLGYYKISDYMVDQIEHMDDIINNKKQIHKQILLLKKIKYVPYFRHTYLQYINRYGETIDELGKEIEGKPTSLKFGQFENGTDITIDKSYLEHIKTLEFSNSKDYDTFFSNQFIILPDYSSLSKQLTFEYIKGYVSSNISNNNKLDTELVNYISNKFSKNKQDFDHVLKLVSNTSFENKLPNEWNKLLLDLGSFGEGFNIIKDKETIDWLSNIKSEYWIKSFIAVQPRNNFPKSPFFEIDFGKTINDQFFKVKYETSELVEYAFGKFKNSPSLSFSLDTRNDIIEHYEWPFINALQNCNVEELDRISSKFGKRHHKFGKYFLGFLEFAEDITPLNIIQLFKYLNSNDYQNIDKKLFEKIIKSILYIKKKNPNFNLKEITEIKYTKYPTSCVNTQFNGESESFLTLSPISFQLMLNTKDEFNLLVNNLFTFDESDIELFLFQKGEPLDNTFPKKFISAYSVEEYVFCIESMANKIKTLHTFDETQIQIIQDLVYTFFKQLLQCNKLSIETLKYVYSIINEINNSVNQINIPISSVFHSFYYLCLKSAKLEKYILKLPHLTSLMNDPDESFEYYYDGYEYEGYDIAKYLDPNVFTFEFIFGNINGNENNCGASFDEILDKLIYHTSHLPGLRDNEMINLENNEKRDYHNHSFNYNLEYFLEIKRQDLFFKELEYIQQFDNTFKQHQLQLFSSTKQNNGQPQSSTIQQDIPTLDYQFQLKDFKFSRKVIQYADRVMDTESFQKLISFNSYIPILKLFHEFNGELSPPRIQNLFNYKGLVNKLLMENGYTKYWSLSTSHEILKDQQLNPEINSLQTIKSLDIVNHFNSSENPCYDLKFHQLIFKLFPNDQPLIKIEIPDVNKAIKDQKFNFLKFYIENNLIKNNQVIQYLKTSLSNNYDFKNYTITWPN